MTDRNKTWFAGLVSEYAVARGLRPAEQAIVDLHLGEIRGGRLLDLGIGAGRTTEQLAPLADSYLGIDYVPELVSAARRANPDVEVEVGDARDLAGVPDGSCDVVLFSFNGIDCVDQADRVKVLHEMRRVVKSGGLVILSSHNRDFRRFNKMPWQTRRFGRRTIRRSLHALRYLPRHRRLSRQAIVNRDWAIINDDAHDWGLLLYYVTIDEMRRQFSAAGFGDVRAYDVDGHRTEAAPDSVSIYYTARAT